MPTNFITDGTTLPFPKVDDNPLPPTESPSRYILAADWNAACQALVDTQTFLRGNFELFDSGGANAVKFLNVSGSPSGSVTAPKGSVATDRTNAKFYKNTDGAAGWSEIGAGGYWALNSSNDLTSLTGFTQRTGAWTLPGGGVQVDDASSEAFLSFDTGTPFLNFAWGVQVDFQYTAAATATNDVGLVLWGNANPVGSWFVRALVRLDGSAIGTDTFGAGNQTSVNPMGALSKSTWYTLTCAVTAKSMLSIWINGTLVYQDGATNISYGSITPSRVGLWSNPGHALFRNLKTWNQAIPV